MKDMLVEDAIVLKQQSDVIGLDVGAAFGCMMKPLTVKMLSSDDRWTCL